MGEVNGVFYDVIDVSLSLMVLQDAERLKATVR